MKKVLALMLVLALVVCVFAGCAKEEAPATDAPAEAPADEPAEAPADDAEAPADDAADFNPADYPVAICMDSYNHPVHRQVQLGFLKKAEELGYTQASVVGTDLGDSQAAWEQGLQFVNAGGKGILLWAGDNSCWETIKALKAAGAVVGIPHFNHMNLNGGELPEGLDFNMACSPAEYGKQVAAMMAEALNGKEGKVAITLNTHNVTEDTADESFRAEWEAQKANFDLSKIELLATELEGGDPTEATNINTGILQANPTIIGAFGTTGNSPLTWSNAVKNCGKEAGSVWIAGMDATAGNLELLKNGEVAVIVAQPLFNEAAKTMEYIDIILRGGTVDAWTDLEAPIVTVDGEGENGYEFHAAQAQEVLDYFGAKGMQVG